MKRNYMAATAAAAILSVSPYMSEACEVVMVLNEHGDPVRINKSDYDANPDAYTLADGVEVPPAPAALTLADGVTLPPAPSAGVDNATPPTTPAPGAMGVIENGKGGAKLRHIVVDATTAVPVEHPDIEPKGYVTQQEAWDAILALQAKMQQAGDTTPPT